MKGWGLQTLLSLVLLKSFQLRRISFHGLQPRQVLGGRENIIVDAAHNDQDLFHEACKGPPRRRRCRVLGALHRVAANVADHAQAVRPGPIPGGAAPLESVARLGDPALRHGHQGGAVADRACPVQEGGHLGGKRHKANPVDTRCIRRHSCCRLEDLHLPQVHTRQHRGHRAGAPILQHGVRERVQRGHNVHFVLHHCLLKTACHHPRNPGEPGDPVC
mmetsp:Transcript_15566/g.39560  ORF Transcript_15566/g.39560 Transcript_15566/m.39560 type:complete len:218 (+) Transcript_15566:178-831(+)